jgi:NAD-dependent SIR2 family protein deacetylase
MEYECLNCGYRFHAKKRDEELEKKYRQCPKCWSVDVFPVEVIEELVQKTLKHRQEAIIGEMLPLLDTMVTVFQERGFRLSPISTIRLIRKVWVRVLEELERAG